MSAVVAAIGIGTAVSAYGIYKSGKANSDNAEAQAAQDQLNADAARAQGAVQLGQQQKGAAKVIGSATAQYSANGIDTGSGSALNVINNSMYEAAQDSANIQATTFAKAQGAQISGQNAAAYGSASATAADLSAAGSLFMGAGSAYGQSIKRGE
jgi:hypothetical protein